MNGREGNDDESESSEEGNINSSVCVWESSMVSVNGSKASLLSASSSFINSSYGALSVYDGGEFKGETITFINNNPGLEHFPSMRYNIICLSTVRVSSLVNITSVGEGSDGEKKNTSMWINSVDNCTIAGIPSTYASAFCIPTLSGMNITRETSSSSENGAVITVSGLQFVPCELSCMVITDDHSFDVELTAVNESVAIGILNQSVMIFMEAASEIGIKLTGENSQDLTEQYSYSDVIWNGTATHTSTDVDDSEKAGSSSVSVVLLVIPLVFIVLLIIVIILLLYLYFSLKRKCTSVIKKASMDVEMMNDQKVIEEGKHAPEEISIDNSYLLPPPAPTDAVSLPPPPSSSSSSQLNPPNSSTGPSEQHTINNTNRVPETMIVTTVVPMIGQSVEGNPPGYVIVTPAAVSIPQSEIQKLVDDGSTEENQEKRKKTKRKKNTKKKNAHRTTTDIDGEEDNDEKEKETGENTNNKHVAASEEVQDMSDDQVSTEETDKDAENEQEERNAKKKKKKKVKKKQKEEEI